jgi:hypothetical protein
METGFPPARNAVNESALSFYASAGEGRSDKILLKQQTKATPHHQ